MARSPPHGPAGGKTGLGNKDRKVVLRVAEKEQPPAYDGQGGGPGARARCNITRGWHDGLGCARPRTYNRCNTECQASKMVGGGRVWGDSKIPRWFACSRMMCDDGGVVFVGVSKSEMGRWWRW